MDKNKIIIDAPQGRSPFINYAEKFLAIVCTAVLWVVVLWHVYQQIFTGYAALLWGLIVFVLKITLGVYLIILLWQEYNLHMFGDKERRKLRKPLSAQELEAMLGITNAQFNVLHQAKRVDLSVSDDNYSYCLNDNQKIEVKIHKLTGGRK